MATADALLAETPQAGRLRKCSCGNEPFLALNGKGSNRDNAPSIDIRGGLAVGACRVPEPGLDRQKVLQAGVTGAP